MAIIKLVMWTAFFQKQEIEISEQFCKNGQNNLWPIRVVYIYSIAAFKTLSMHFTDKVLLLKSVYIFSVDKICNLFAI